MKVHASLICAVITLSLGACVGDVTDEGGHDEVVVTTLRGSRPAPAVDVVFHDHAGEVLAFVHADSNGEARYASPDIAYVTVVEGDALFYNWLVTYAVEPGARVVEHKSDVEVVGHLAVEYPGPVSGATAYAAHNGCWASEPGPLGSQTLSLAGWCLTNGDDLAGQHFSVIARAIDGDERPLAYSVAEHIEYTGSDVAVPLPTWRSDLYAFDLRLESLPLVPVSVSASVASVMGGHAYGVDHSTSTSSTTASSVTLSLRYAVALGSAALAWWAEDGFGTTWSELRHVAGWPGSTTVDFAASTIGPVPAPTFSVGTGVARPEVTWRVPATDVDAVAIDLHWSTSHWAAVLPPDRTSFRFPALPSELRERAPTGGDHLELTFLEADWLAGYHAWRSTADHSARTEPNRILRMAQRYQSL